MERRITIVKIQRYSHPSVNEELQWLGESLGLFGTRDKDKSCFRIFIELLKAAKHDRAVSSDDLSEQLRLARGTVIHHVNNLIETGIVVQERKKYRLREEELSALIKDLRNDLQRTLDDIERAASDVDKLLGFQR